MGSKPSCTYFVFYLFCFGPGSHYETLVSPELYVEQAGFRTVAIFLSRTLECMCALKNFTFYVSLNKNEYNKLSKCW